MDLHEFARQMPKVELHVHLEGSIRPATLLELARRNGIRLPAKDEQGLQAFYRFSDFDHFVTVFLTVSACLKTAADLEVASFEFGRDCARQNIRYAEVTFTMTTALLQTGLPWTFVLEALNLGRARAGQEFGVDWRWVLDINRNHPETQDQVVDIALQARPFGVVALGLGGVEADFPACLFKGAFERARREGLPRVPHAGETSGPQSVLSALNDLHADRIGHGVRCAEDPALMDLLRSRRVPLEICPTSNIRTGVYRNYTEHPVRRLWDAGLAVTINSDDPALFGSDLVGEYRVLVEHFAFGADELAQVSRNAVSASLLPAPEKQRLGREFEEWFATNPG